LSDFGKIICRIPQVLPASKFQFDGNRYRERHALPKAIIKILRVFHFGNVRINLLGYCFVKIGAVKIIHYLTVYMKMCPDLSCLFTDLAEIWYNRFAHHSVAYLYRVRLRL